MYTNMCIYIRICMYTYTIYIRPLTPWLRPSGEAQGASCVASPNPQVRKCTTQWSTRDYLSDPDLYRCCKAQFTQANSYDVDVFVFEASIC